MQHVVASGEGGDNYSSTNSLKMHKMSLKMHKKKNNIWMILPFPRVLPLPLKKAGMQSARDVCFSCLSFLRWQNALFWLRTGLY